MQTRFKDLSGSKLFLWTFGLTSIVGILVIIASHLALASNKLLAPPPYVATWCIDQKLDFLAASDLDEVQLAAVGSSGAWRNLDMSVFEYELNLKSLNAAPCYLYADQTAYLSEFLLPRMPKLDVLLYVALPRDFERCVPEDEAFFDRQQLGLVLDGRMPRWLPYVSGFRPVYVANFARAKFWHTGDVGAKVYDDGLGSAVLDQKMSWSPDLVLSDACYPAMTRLEELANANGVDLVVALAPTDPAWRSEKDPDGSALHTWRQKLRSSVSDDVIIIDGEALGLGSKQFSDALHLIHPNQVEFSRFIARAIADRSSADTLDSDTSKEE